MARYITPILPVLLLVSGLLPSAVDAASAGDPPVARDIFPRAGADPLLDGGTVTAQPGAVLHVDLVDETGAPVPQHNVFLEPD